MWSPRDRVVEAEVRRVEEQAVEPGSGRRIGATVAVDVVADDGMADGQQVHPDLVRAARLERAAEQPDGPGLGSARSSS